MTSFKEIKEPMSESAGKKVSGKKPGIKNFGKKFQIFSSPWKKCH